MDFAIDESGGRAAIPFPVPVMAHEDDEGGVSFFHQPVYQFRVLDEGSPLELFLRDMGQFDGLDNIVRKMVVEVFFYLTEFGFAFVGERRAEVAPDHLGAVADQPIYNNV